MGLDQIRADLTGEFETGSEGIGFDQTIRPDWISPECKGQEQTGSDRIEQECTGLNPISSKYVGSIQTRS